MNVDGVELRFDKGLWLGFVRSRFGVLEAIIDGEPSGPDGAKLNAFRRFLPALDENIVTARRDIRFGFLWLPIRIAVNNENRVGVQFRNRITGNQGKLILERKAQPKLCAVAGAGVYRDADGRVIYNSLTPHMQQFMGRCIGAMRKAGISARGTGQFSVLLGDPQTEITLEEFYEPTDDPGPLDRVLARAREIVAQQ